MTDQEKKILEFTRDTWNAFIKLPIQSQDDMQEFRFHIHALQNIILAREGMRFMLQDKVDQCASKENELP